MREGSWHELARAKLNLTLRVLGRRSDGYHELDSLVAFADIGDRVSLVAGAGETFKASGPFAADIVGANLVEKAIDAIKARWPGTSLGRVHLQKDLPVAAGIGGGSADAAATLRLARAANPDLGTDADWGAIAASLGSDVPVCLASRAAFMRGRGEHVVSLVTFPQVHAVIVNPLVPLSTADVFRALRAPLLGGSATARPVPAAVFQGQAKLLDYLGQNRNDLEAPARALCPAIGDILAALRSRPKVLAVGMSGSGPTCFGLFAAGSQATDAAGELRQAEPGWWVAAAALS
jgi:4-diphosphocytidyl-2-C-methyl-D-erythritol kinase